MQEIILIKYSKMGKIVSKIISKLIFQTPFYAVFFLLSQIGAMKSPTNAVTLIKMIKNWANFSVC